MARDFGPFPSKPMYEVVNRRMQRALAEATASTGFAKSGQGAVTAGTGAQLVIAAYPDGALVDGLYVENPASETVTLTTNTASTNPRIDRLVMRLDMAAETIAPFQIVGTPGASPSAPPLVQTATVFDMPLCQYRFPGSGSAQNPGSIVDERVIATNPSPLRAVDYTTGGINSTTGYSTLTAESITVTPRDAAEGRRIRVGVRGNFGSGTNSPFVRALIDGASLDPNEVSVQLAGHASWFFVSASMAAGNYVVTVEYRSHTSGTATSAGNVGVTYEVI